jgi:hypothetical protein
LVSTLFNFLPWKKLKPQGSANTQTYRPGNSEFLSLPAYDSFRRDLYQDRQREDSNVLLQRLFRDDPDCSAAVNAYLTTSNTEVVFHVKDSNGEYSQDGYRILEETLNLITRRTDYSVGFKKKLSLMDLRNNFKYMLLLRGSIGAELVVNKLMQPEEIRNVDMVSVKWLEKKPGEYKPVQETTESNQEISLDIPTFYTASYHQDPTIPYTFSVFVSAVNIIAARQQVINDLYRIMRITGYPRVDIEVVEEVLGKNAPPAAKQDPNEYRQYLQQSLQAIVNSFSSVRADQPYAHTDSVKTKILNDRSSSMGLQISEIVETLNAQNQAALKAVSSFLGRGQSGVNTASVEAQVFAKNANELNGCIDNLLSEVLTMAVRIMGFDGIVDVRSQPVNLRPEMELEPQMALKQSRLLQDLGLGLISDEEYHLQMYGRIPLWNYVKLSGTDFQGRKIDSSDVSSNSDPMGRALTPEDSEAARSNSV